MEADNLFEEIALYDQSGRQIGKVDRKTAHSDKRYLHGAVHIFLFNQKNQLLLQRRSRNKILLPLRFDISAGGHIAFGEREDTAAIRELEEELGISKTKIEPLYQYIWEGMNEREYVFTYITFYDGEINFLKSEIEEVRFFNIPDIKPDPIFTPNLLYELELLKKTNHYKKFSY
jgi:16S rRNA (adenine1518-N6/adenine1519-N6)-dimethyltransferase